MSEDEMETGSPPAAGAPSAHVEVIGDPTPPLLAVDAAGFVWRVYETGWSMAPSNPDNEPIPGPCTHYVPEQPTRQNERERLATLLDENRSTLTTYPATPEDMLDLVVTLLRLPSGTAS